MRLRGLGNLCSSAVYNQGQITLIFNTISCGLQSSEYGRHISTTGKSKREHFESAKTNFTNDDIMKYVMGALQ